MLRVQPITGEYYHIFNRGVDKRTTFENTHDIKRFLAGLYFFNTVKPTVSLAHKESKLDNEESFRRRKLYESKDDRETTPLVSIIAYHLLPNHYHLILQQVTDGGISEFQKRIGGGYTNYFNEKHDRTGPLFSGRYKIAHIRSDEQLRYVFAYVSCNDIVHDASFPFSIQKNISRLISSKHQYEHNLPGLCDTSTTSAYVANAAFWEEAASLAQEIRYIRELNKMTLE